ncbi:MAG: FeoB small GTPase domain-containing protein [Bacteroidota bacterium]
MSTIALIGNPNSGKSSIFNQLTGLRQKVANFPGVTVEKKTGRLHLPGGADTMLVDFPGAYSLHPTSQDERVVLDVLSNPSDENFPDAVVYVADVTNLEKHLLLLTQIKDLGLPCVLALNMSDLAEKEGLSIDERALAGFLGMPVVSVSGRTGSNFEQLKKAMADLLHDRKNGQNHAPFYPFSPVEKQVVAQIQEKTGVKNPYRALLWAHQHDPLHFLTKDEKRLNGGI